MIHGAYLQTARRGATAAAVGRAPLAPWIAGGIGIAALTVAALVTGDPALLLLAATVALVAGTAALILRPDLATIAVLVLIYSNAPVIGAQLYGVPYLLAALVPALLFLPLAERVLLRRESLVIPPTLPFVIGFLVVEIVSTLASRSPAAASAELGRVISEGVLLYLLIVSTVRTLPILRMVMLALVAVAGVLAGLTIIQQVAGMTDESFLGFARITSRGFDPGTGAALQPRAGGPIGEQNFYAQMLLAVVPLGITLVRTERGLLRLGAVLATAVIAIGVMLTFSRGAGIAAVLLIPAMIALRVVGRRGLLALAIAGVVLLAAVPNYAERLSSLETIGGAVSVSEDTDPVIAQRANDILAAVQVFADHPIVGVGPGLFPTYYREYANRVGGIPGDAEYATHNVYAEIASETGLLGFFAFGGIIVTTLVVLLQARRRLRDDPRLAAIAEGFVLVIVVYLATGLFLHISYQRYIWTFLALSVAAAMILRSLAPPTATAALPGVRRLTTAAGGRARRVR